MQVIKEGHTWGCYVVHSVVGKDRLSNEILQVGTINFDCLGRTTGRGAGGRLALNQPEGSFAEDFFHLFLQVTHATLATVGTDERLKRFRLNVHLLIRYTRITPRLWDQILFRNVHLLLGDVTRNINHLNRKNSNDNNRKTLLQTNGIW